MSKRYSRICFSLVLGVVVFCTLLSIPPKNSSQVFASNIAVSSPSELFSAVKNAPNDLGAPYVITLSNTIYLNEYTTLVIPLGKHILLTGTNNSRWLHGAADQPTITVEGILTLDTISIGHQIKGSTKTSMGSGVFVKSGAVFNMIGGQISNNIVQGIGAGVYNNGTFNMSAGTIIENASRGEPSSSNGGGGGVYNDGGLFNMSGGIITNNTSVRNGGGVCNRYNTVFNMSGGLIVGNISTSGGGGGVINSDSTFNMTGGEISLNMAVHGGGVYTYSGEFNLFEGEVLKNIAFGRTTNGNTCGQSHGGGVCFGRNTVFNMYGGKISHNTVTVPNTLSSSVLLLATRGGGVHSTGLFNMYGGEISYNTADVPDVYLLNGYYSEGGGVYIAGDFFMSGGQIYENQATNGGGVYLQSNGAIIDWFRQSIFLSGGEISNNTASCNGGGVYNESGGTISGTIIFNNTAGNDGGGIYSPSSIRILETTVSHNTAGNNGGGIYSTSSVRISEAKISNNTAANNGGGIYSASIGIYNYGTIEIISGTISSNTAMNGGGIWTEYTNLRNITVASGVIFTENKSSIAYARNLGDDVLYNKQIGNNGSDVSWTWPFTQGYNNYDISYENGNQFFRIVFMQNHSFYDKTILDELLIEECTNIGESPKTPIRNGFVFVSWNTSPQGDGTTYTDSGPIIFSNLVLYAQYARYEDVEIPTKAPPDIVLILSIVIACAFVAIAVAVFIGYKLGSKRNHTIK